MPDQLEYMNFPGYSFYIRHIDYSALFKDLYCHFLTCRNVNTQLHLAKCALAY